MASCNAEEQLCTLSRRQESIGPIEMGREIEPSCQCSLKTQILPDRPAVSTVQDLSSQNGLISSNLLSACLLIYEILHCCKMGLNVHFDFSPSTNAVTMSMHQDHRDPRSSWQKTPIPAHPRCLASIDTPCSGVLDDLSQQGGES